MGVRVHVHEERSRPFKADVENILLLDVFPPLILSRRENETLHVIVCFHRALYSHEVTEYLEEIADRPPELVPVPFQDFRKQLDDVL